MDLLFRKNQTFLLVLNVAAWEPIYPLASCTFRMMAKTSLTRSSVACAFSSDPSEGFAGTIQYDATTHMLTIRMEFDRAHLLNDGSYPYDLQLLYGGQVVKLLTTGTLVIQSGATT